MILVLKPKVVPQIIGNFWLRMAGEITQEEMDRRNHALTDPQPDLPLGIGASTEVRRER